MPTGTCNYPGHHGSPSAGPPIGLLAAIAAGALIIANVHAVIVTLTVVAVLTVLAGGVMLLVHSHRSAPYDAAWAELEIRNGIADLQSAQAVQIGQARADLRARVDQLERQLAERPAIEAPQQHLHLHGISSEDLAAVLAQRHAIDDK